MCRRFHAPFVIMFVCVGHVFGGTLSLDWSTDKEPVSYRSGDPMQFKLRPLDDANRVSGNPIKSLRPGDDGPTAQGEAVTATTTPLAITSSIKQPGFVLLEITIFNEEGPPAKTASGVPVKFDGVAGADPENWTIIANLRISTRFEISRTCSWLRCSQKRC